MRRFILLVLASLMFISSSYADLGDIKVNSYLSQRFDATVQLTNMPKDTDFDNLSFGLANGNKFKEYGIDFNPELGSFIFQIITNTKIPYVKITSTKPINSPVLNFLLHYRIQKDDFYRQYTVLLDPIDYSTVNSSSKNNKTIVVRAFSNDGSEKSYSRPIPIYAKSNNQIKNNIKPSFEMDLSNPAIRDSLANFNKESMLYTTESGDSLYTIARFNQLIYPQAQLNINQIMIALGLENFPLMHAPENLYESGVAVKIPDAQKISVIPSSLADEYLLDNTLSKEQRISTLKAIAGKYSQLISIESDQLFVEKVSNTKAINLNSSQVRKLFHPQKVEIKEQNSSILDFIFGFLPYILAFLLTIIFVIFIRKKYPDFSLREILKKFKVKRSVTNTEQVSVSDNNIYADTSKFSHHKSLVKQQSYISNNDSIDSSSQLAEDSSSEFSESIQDESHIFIQDFDSNVEPKSEDQKKLTRPEASIDLELLETLEKILLMDSSRDDIRYKLFELYLMTGIFDKASKIFYQLDRNLEVNDSLRENIQDICQKYNFTPLSEANISDLDDIVINSEPDYPSLNELDDNNVVTLEDHVADNNILNSDINLDAHPEDPNRVVDFISFAPAESISVTDEVVSFSQERVLDFSVVDFKPLDEEAPIDYSDEGRDISISSTDPIADLIPKESTSVIVSDDNTFDEKLNLARMYFHIEESDKAKDILNQLLENKNLSEDLKLEISKLKAEMGING